MRYFTYSTRYAIRVLPCFEEIFRITILPVSLEEVTRVPPHQHIPHTDPQENGSFSQAPKMHLGKLFILV